MKKLMKFFAVFSCIAAMGFLFSCSKDDSGYDKELIEGKLYVTLAKYGNITLTQSMMDAYYVGDIYEFDSEGKFTMSFSSGRHTAKHGSYTFNGKVVSLAFGDDNYTATITKLTSNSASATTTVDGKVINAEFQKMN